MHLTPRSHDSKTWSINWRFGVIGLCLYRFGRHKPDWPSKKYVSKLFGRWFLLVFGMIFAIPALTDLYFTRSIDIFVWFGLTLVVLAIVSVAYGKWAAAYFDKMGR